MWTMHDGFGWWAVVGTLWMVLFWGGLAWLVVRAFSGTAAQRDPPDSFEVARRRYANGEITREEFLRIAEDLRTAPRSAAGSG